MRELAQRKDVRRIEANRETRMQRPVSETRGMATKAIEWNIALIGAPDVWAMGITGQGAVIGGQDTGYDWEHPALKNSYRGWNGASANHSYNWHDSIHLDNAQCNGDSTFPCDDADHGTHTMGTMVGDDGGGQSDRCGAGCEMDRLPKHEQWCRYTCQLHGVFPVVPRSHGSEWPEPECEQSAPRHQQFMGLSWL